MKSLKIFGIVALSAVALTGTNASAADLITNGGFETGDFTGWITNPLSFPEYTVTAPVESGVYAAQIAGFAFGPDTLTQNVTTTAGQSYVLSFGYFQDGGIPSGLSAIWDGVTVYMQVPDTDTGGAYQDVSVTVVGQGSDSLVFSAYNDPAYTYLDDVSLTGVPEAATWLMMLFGSGAVGAALRNRRRLATAA
jgi:hypothetical protein